MKSKNKKIKQSLGIRLLDKNGYFNHHQLEKAGWDSESHMRLQYVKYWYIQDLDGSKYKVKVSLTEAEDCCFIYVNDQWIGRITKLSEAESIVKSIQKHCF